MPDKLMIIEFDEKDDEKIPARMGDRMKHELSTAVETRLAGNRNVMESEFEPDKLEDMVKFNSIVPDEETAVVMLRAVAAAETQPTHGVFTRAAIVSLLVAICM